MADLLEGETIEMPEQDHGLIVRRQAQQGVPEGSHILPGDRLSARGRVGINLPVVGVAPAMGGFPRSLATDRPLGGIAIPTDAIHQVVFEDPAQPDPQVIGVGPAEPRETPMRLEQRLLYEVGIVVFPPQIARNPESRDRHQVRPEGLEEDSERRSTPSTRRGQHRHEGR
jgi:hypothetical protein